ncbi:MAG TPA: DUF2868 domain-containing protein [Chthoniobacter sp.]
MRRTDSWNLDDVLDFEWMLARDRSAGDEELQKRDYTIRRKIVTASPEIARDRRAMLHAWLQARREETPTSLPGDCFNSGWQTLVTIAGLVGLGLGGSVTVGLLHYRTGEPVNVSWFLALTVGVQMLVLFLAVLLSLIHTTTNWFSEFRPLRGLLTALTWATSAGLRRLPAEQRDPIRATLAVIRSKREIYGSLATWPFLVVTQIFAVAYNIGILATLGTHLAFANLHFQWESTLVQSPAVASQIVSALSLPWSEFAPEATLTQPQVEDSHNIDSVRFRRMLESNDPKLHSLIAWWPFLCVVVGVYGLLVRGALLAFAAIQWQRSLRKLRFDHADANALWRRLSGPLVTAPPEAEPVRVPSSGAPDGKHHSAGPCAVLIARELNLDRAALRAHLARRFGWEMGPTWPVKIDNRQESSAILRELRDTIPKVAGVVVVAPIERDPIVAIGLFLKDVLAASGADPEVVLLLAGPPAMDERLKFWRNFNAIQGLHLGLERWAP